MCAVLAAAVPAAAADDAKSLGHRSMFSQLMKTGNETETKRKKKHLEKQTRALAERIRRSASSNQLDVPSFRLPTVGSRVFSIAGAKVWNSSPPLRPCQPSGAI